MRKDKVLDVTKSDQYKRLINSYRWQLLRRKQIIKQPLCEDCLKKGRVTVAEEVHHAIPVESGKDFAEMQRLAYDFSNLVSLCRECHYFRHHPQSAKEQADTSFTARFFGATNKGGGHF